MKPPLIFLILFCIVFISRQIIEISFPKWTFNRNDLNILYDIIGYVSFFGLLFCILLLLTNRRTVLIPVAILFSLLVSCESYFAAFPFDSQTAPEDFQVIHIYKDGRKLISRKYQNAKTGTWNIDTAIVWDNNVFRRIDSLYGWHYANDVEFELLTKGVGTDSRGH